jgi:hypothetical protein
MSRRNSLIIGGCNTIGLVLLALSAAGGSTVRAGDPSGLQNSLFEPLSQIVMGIEQRVADFEATLSTFAISFTSERIVAQQLCVADDSGAQTCISKAQLDALLKAAVHVGDASTVVEPPVVAAVEAVAPTAEVAAVAPSVTEPPAAPAAEPVLTLRAEAAVVPALIEQPAVTAVEPAISSPEIAAVTPPVGEKTAEAAVETVAPTAAVTTATPIVIEAVEVAVVTTTRPATAMPEIVAAAEEPAKDEAPAHTGSVIEATPVVNVAPGETPLPEPQE